MLRLRQRPPCRAVLAQQTRQGGKFYERGSVRIYYEEAGSGFPLLLLPGGGLNSTIGFFTGNAPFNAIEEFQEEYRCITADLRNAPSGQSTGPVEVDRPWESYADDQLGLMDHLGIDRFFVMGFCIGGPFIWSLLKRAPNRIVAAVVAQPVGWRPEMREPKYPGAFWKSWGALLTAKRPEISLQLTDQFVTKMFETDPDFVFTVTRDFVRSCQNPVLILPDEVPAHPYAVAMECAMLAPKAEVSLFRGKSPRSEFRWRCARFIRSCARIGRRRRSESLRTTKTTFRGLRRGWEGHIGGGTEARCRLGTNRDLLHRERRNRRAALDRMRQILVDARDGLQK